MSGLLVKGHGIQTCGPRLGSNESKIEPVETEQDGIPVKQEIIPHISMQTGRYREGLPVQLRNIFLRKNGQ